MAGRSRFQAILHGNQREYFLYFLTVVLAIILLVSGALYINFSSVLRRNAIAANTSAMHQLKASQEQILEEVVKSLSNVVMDPVFVNYPDSYHRRDTIVLLAAQGKLDGILALNAYVDSLYLYYPHDGIVLSATQGIVPIGDSVDRDFATGLPGRSIGGLVVSSRVKREFNTLRDISVLTFVMPMPINPVGDPKGFVVIDMKGSYLESLLDAIRTEDDAIIFLSDREGNILSRKSGVDLSLQRQIAGLRLTPEEERAQYVIRQIGRQRMLISRMESTRYHLSYWYAIPMSVVRRGTGFLGLVTIAVCLLVTMFGILGSFILSRRIYLPLKVILTLLNEGRADTPAPGDKETVRIESDVSRLIEKTRDLQRQLVDFEVLQRSEFLKALVAGGLDQESRVEERLAYYRIPLEVTGRFLVLVIVMDGYEEFLQRHPEKERNLFMVSVKELVSRVALATNRGFLVDTGANEISVVVAPATEDALAQLPSRLHETLDRETRHTFTVGVGSPREGIEHLHASYREAVTAVNYRLLLGSDHVLTFNDLHPGDREGLSYRFDIEKTLLDSLRSGDRDGIERGMQNFVTHLKNNHTDDLRRIRYDCLHLLSSTMRCIHGMGIHADPATITGADPYAALLTDETLDTMAARLRSLFAAVVSRREEQRSDRGRLLVSSIREYIARNLGGDLSQERLSSEFFISISHLRKLFKDGTGTTIKEYIDQTRIDTAKELLESTHGRVGEIASRVGYLSVQAFNRAFKQATGSTPGGYRAQRATRSGAGSAGT